MGAKQLLWISSLVILALIAGSMQGCKKPTPPDAGALQITLKPATIAYELGGKWSLDGGAPNDSGAILQNILVGTHTVTFTDIAQWETPPQQNVLITKDQTATLEATYYKQFTLTTSVLGNGSVVPAQGAHVYRENEQVTLAATARPGWAFDHWEGDLGSEDPAETLLMNADKAVTAVFIQLPSFTLTIDIEGAGTTVPGEGVHIYDEGNLVAIVATPATGWHFDHWSGALTGTQASGQLTMNGNLQLTAHFARNQVTYSLGASAQPGAGGTVALFPAGGEYPSGSSVVASATPAQYYRFAGWTGGITSTDNPVSIEMNQDRAIVANFVYEPPHFTLDTWIQPSAGGSVALNPQQPEGGYLVGAQVTVTAVPNANYAFTGWLGNASGGQNPLTITMDANKTLAALFEFRPARVSVTASALPANAGMVILSPPDILYIPGTEISAAALADADFRFDGWEGDITGASNPITFTVTTNMTIRARFVPREMLLATSVEPPQGGFLTLTPPGGSYLMNTMVNLLATAHQGYFFKEWQGDATGTYESVSVKMNSNKQVTALFDWEVKFPDANLDAAVREALGFKGIESYYASDLANLITLNAPGRNIQSIEGLQNCPNLVSVNLANNKITNLWPLVNNPNFGSGCILMVTSNALTWTACDPLDRLEARGVTVSADDVCSGYQFVSLRDYWPMETGSAWPKALFGCGATLLSPAGTASASNKTVAGHYEINGHTVWKLEYLPSGASTQKAAEYYTFANGGLYLTTDPGDFSYLPELTLKPILPEKIALGQPCYQCDRTFGLLTLQRGKLSSFLASLAGFAPGDLDDVLACSFTPETAPEGEVSEEEGEGGGISYSPIFGRCLGPIYTCVLAAPVRIEGTCE